MLTFCTDTGEVPVRNSSSVTSTALVPPEIAAPGFQEDRCSEHKIILTDPFSPFWHVLPDEEVDHGNDAVALLRLLGKSLKALRW